MNKSLEALEELKDEIIPDYALEYEDDEGYKDWVIELYNTIKQDLEYLEQLNKENLDLMSEIQEVHKENLTIKELRKENQELIVNKNVAQAVALNQKREIAELKDQISYLKEDGEEWQSAYEWSQTENSILKSENQELKTTLLEYKAQENLYWTTATNNVNLREENEKLKKAIEILKEKTNMVIVADTNNHFITYDTYGSAVVTKKEYELLKEVFSNDRT